LISVTPQRAGHLRPVLLLIPNNRRFYIMQTNLLTQEHIDSFNTVVGGYLSQGFDMGFDFVKAIVGIGVLLIVIKILISKL